MIMDVLVSVQLVGEICSLKDFVTQNPALKTLNDKAVPFVNDTV